MEIHLTHGINSPSSSSSSPNPNPNPSPNPNSNPIHTWWEAISKARSRIQSLSLILSSPSSSSSSISSLAESDRPARSLLESQDAYLAISAALSLPHSGSGEDPLCQWLYETYQSSDQDLRLVVISFIPLLAGLYLSRIISSQNPNPSLAGFEAVLLSLFAAETRSRAGKPLLISIPDLSQPSLYHSPRTKATGSQSQTSVGVLSAPLEPQIAVKSTKRACIVAVALDQYFKSISLMPSCSKLDFCEFAAAWAGQNCSCKNEFDGDREELEIVRFSEVGDKISGVSDEMGNLGVGETSNGWCSEARVSRGVRIPLPWELLQPMLRILGHCLLAPLNLPDVRDSASVSVRCLYARASHDLVPQAILATRSLIQLNKRARVAAKAAAANAASNANTPTKPKKPEILLVSK